MFIPNSEEAAQSAVNALKDVKYTVIGNGSNLLVRDEGYDGVVIKISAAMSGVETDGDIITAAVRRGTFKGRERGKNR